jgi:hypothetical protein
MATESNGNGGLTREVLRAELRAGLAEQKNSIYAELDRRLEPINEHVQRIDRGEFTPAQEAGIVKVMQKNKDARLTRRSVIAPIIAVGVSLLSLGLTTVLTLVAVGVLGGGSTP